MKFVVRLPSRRVFSTVDDGQQTITSGREVAIEEDDVIGFVLGYAAAHGDTIKVVDDAMPERHRRMQLLLDAQHAGLLTYLGTAADTERPTP